MISELILKKRMIKGEIEINRDSISKSKETLLQDPLGRLILRKRKFSPLYCPSI